MRTDQVDSKPGRKVFSLIRLQQLPALQMHPSRPPPGTRIQYPALLSSLAVLSAGDFLAKYWSLINYLKLMEKSFLNLETRSSFTEAPKKGMTLT